MSSPVEIRAPVSRISVWRGRQCVPLPSGPPIISSAHSPWQGALLERHAHGPQSVDPHVHLSHFLCLHLDGPSRIEWHSNGKTGSKAIVPGSIILVSRGTEDAVSYTGSVSEAAQRLFLTLDPKLFQHAVPDVDLGRDAEFVEQWGIEDRQIEYILRALDADLEAGLPAGGLFGESLLNSLAVYLQRRYGVKPIAELKPRNGLPKTRLNRVLEFIEEHLDQDITLAALADTAGMGPHYFSELFKQSLGISPHQYVLRRRIDRGRRLLHNPSISVLEAAVRTGFSDQSHFTKLFRRIVGVTPTKYRSIL